MQENEFVSIVYDIHHSKVDMPEHLKIGSESGRVNVPHLEGFAHYISRSGIRVTDSYRGELYSFFIPWKAMFTFVVKNKSPTIFPNDMPLEYVKRHIAYCNFMGDDKAIEVPCHLRLIK